MSSSTEKFLLDANVFIEASNRYYSFDLCPGFWRAVKIEHKNGNMLSISKVKNEIVVKSDGLSMWAKKTIPSSFFIPVDDKQVIAKYSEIINWVDTKRQFRTFAKAEFAQGADGWLIAYASVNDFDVITQEKYDPDTRKRVPIPNVCKEFKVNFLNTFEMLTKLNVAFVLEK
ncbi:MAG: DUF4411 family protein [candidate division Zixibacteria bacterium]|nr:DUF4411 family protein [candidate division Zixibacteria bacterium]